MKLKTDPVKIKSKGHFSLKVLNSSGEEVVEKSLEACKNTVTYNGAYRMLFQDRLFESFRIAIGTGTTEITRSSISLNAVDSYTPGSVGTSRLGNETDNGDGTSTLTQTRTLSFGLGALSGTYSEVGLYDGTDFIAGQLIKDELGNPTTITILPDEELIVTYTMEIVFPNGEQGTAPVLGTGTVTTPEGSSTWTVYGQPLFCDYSINASSKALRTDGSGRYFVQNADGTSAQGVVSSGTLFNAAKSHDGSGNVTLTTASFTSAPSDFTNASLVYFVPGTFAAGPAATEMVDPATKRQKSGNNSSAFCVVEFSPALVKSSDRSFSVQVEVNYTV